MSILSRATTITLLSTTLKAYQELYWKLHKTSEEFDRIEVCVKVFKLYPTEMAEVRKENNG